MSPDETRAVLTVSLLAAFADGRKHEREHAEVRRIAEALAGPDGLNMPALVQDVMLERVSLAAVLPALASEDARHLAYEMAVCVCDADGAQSPAEQAFLAELRQGLQLDLLSAEAFAKDAETLAGAPLAVPAAPAPDTAAAASAAAAAAGAPAATVDEAALEREILNAATLNGALELLPESLSTMAIIPLQMKLVYRIGQAYGYQLDAGHVKDFLATAGVGLTSQYLEQAGRKLIGGLLGRLGGGLLGGLGRQAVSSGMSFVSTWALGQLARRYYAGGRVMNAQLLKDSYLAMTQQAQAVYERQRPAIEQQARSLDASKVMTLVRGR